jgi:hypothetical protein
MRVRTITLVIYVIVFTMFWHNGVINILHNDMLLMASRKFDALSFPFLITCLTVAFKASPMMRKR